MTFVVTSLLLRFSIKSLLFFYAAGICSLSCYSKDEAVVGCLS